MPDDVTTVGGMSIRTEDITHTPRRMQSRNLDIYSVSEEPQNVAQAPNSVTIERAIKYYEERVSNTPEPFVPLELIPLYAMTAKWLREYMNRSTNKSAEKVLNNE